MIRWRADSSDIERRFGRAALQVPRARRALLRILAIDTEREATRLASGNGAPGNYPIPVRTGFFRRAFGFEVRDPRAVVFNAAGYARPIHEGYRPYGNPNAMVIRPRRYFDDALQRIDLDEAHAKWEAALA